MEILRDAKKHWRYDDLISFLQPSSSPLLYSIPSSVLHLPVYSESDMQLNDLIANYPTYLIPHEVLSLEEITWNYPYSPFSFTRTPLAFYVLNDQAPRLLSLLQKHSILPSVIIPHDDFYYFIFTIKDLVFLPHEWKKIADGIASLYSRNLFTAFFPYYIPLSVPYYILSNNEAPTLNMLFYSAHEVLKDFINNFCEEVKR